MPLTVLEKLWQLDSFDAEELASRLHALSLLRDLEEVECLFTLDAPVHTIAVIPARRIIVAGDATGRVHFFDFIEP